MAGPGGSPAADVALGEADPVRFLRHLGAATLVVGVVVLLGLAWNHFGAATLVGGQQAAFRQVPAGARQPGAVALRAGAKAGGPHGPLIVRNGPMNLGLSSMLEPVNLAVLKHTVVIEAVVIAIVVMIDVSRRLWRQERRARQLAVSRSDDDPDD
jgi:hypothetical protein